ncbi:hypothetical protein [Nitrospira sp. Kam-Ns4a]
MSYADCFSAALAKSRKAESVTGDREFRQVKVDVKILWLRIGRTCPHALSRNPTGGSARAEPGPRVTGAGPWSFTATGSPPTARPAAGPAGSSGTPPPRPDRPVTATRTCPALSGPPRRAP